MASPVRLTDLVRHFPNSVHPAVDHLSLEISTGEVLCLVGPSGCGKSTTLRLVAGLDVPDSGKIEIGVRDMSGVAPQARDVAMVFQGFALYPHMTVRQILAFPLKMRRIPRAQRNETVTRTARLLSIEPLLDRRPAQLSGGEQQRVAMGRALVRKPEVFLFDEPLSNLDAALRAELRVELGKLLRTLESTAIYVTHDQTEAMTLGHRIAVMRLGRIEQLDTPRAIYEAPSSTFVASFFGTPPMNLFRPTTQQPLSALAELQPPAPGLEDRAILGVRPEHVLVGPRATNSGLRYSEARVVSVELHGAETHVELERARWRFRAKIPGFEAPELDALVPIALPRENLRWFDSDTELSIEQSND